MIEQKKMDAELLPCPHCNGGAEMRLYDGDYFVQCVECFASTAADYQTEQAAAEKWNRRGLPVGVPDGWRPIDTAPKDRLLMLWDGEHTVGCWCEDWGNWIPCLSHKQPTFWMELPAAPTVKAEQVPTPEFVWVRLLQALAGDNGCPFAASTDDYREAKPALVELIAAGFFRDDADSLDGDIWRVAAGEQGEAAARFASCADAYAVLSDVLNRVFERPEEAPSLPAAGSADQPYPDGIAEDLERSDWTPLEALQWYAAGKHFDVVGSRTRIIDTGAVASNALKHASLAYLELKGDAELSELRAALSAQQAVRSLQTTVDQLSAIEKSADARQARIYAVAAQQAGAVSVPVELLRVACSGGNEAWQALEELRALLNGGGV